MEDDGIISMQMERKLEGWGYQVVGVVESSKKAVSKALESSPDLILMDIVLRGNSDGIGAVENIKRHLDIPVIYTTAYNDEATIERARKTNPEAYLIKPYESFQMQAAIEIAIQRHQFQKKLRKSEEKYRKLFEKSINGILICQAIEDSHHEVMDFLLADANPSFLRLMHLKKEDVVGKNASEVFSGVESSELFSNLKEIITFQYPKRFEYSKNKNYYDIMAFPTGANEVAALVMNITTKKKYDIALQSSEERYRKLVENSKDVFYRMALPSGEYEYISPAVYELVGYTVDEHYDTPSLGREIIHPEWKAYFDREFARLLSGKAEPFYEYPILTKWGEVRWIHQSNVLLNDEDGQPVALESIMRDMTYQKKAECALLDLEYPPLFSESKKPFSESQKNELN
ncbi:MAG TPA: PAS domain S-box protein [Methanobacteriaceae archaeon]|nr:PAS domain S-box protein [Methanobacteriaceae archaeon]